MSEETKVVSSAPECQEAKKGFKLEFAPYRHVMYKICKNCGRIFIVPDNDVVYFVQKFGTVPQRCATCRNNRRKHFEETSEVTSD